MKSMEMVKFSAMDYWGGFWNSIQWISGCLCNDSEKEKIRVEEESSRCSISIWTNRLKVLVDGPLSSLGKLHLKTDITLCLNSYFGDYLKFTWPWVFNTLTMANLHTNCLCRQVLSDFLEKKYSEEFFGALWILFLKLKWARLCCASA